MKKIIFSSLIVLAAGVLLVIGVGCSCNQTSQGDQASTDQSTTNTNTSVANSNQDDQENQGTGVPEAAMDAKKNGQSYGNLSQSLWLNAK